MNSKTTRRSFLKRATAAGLATPFLGASPSRARGANESVNLACVGVGGKGWSDMSETSAGQNVVALCDVDAVRLAKASAKFPKAKTFTDWRKLLEQKEIDAVTISTPDHTHAIVTGRALSLGKHVYTQKPLTHDVAESRHLTQLAAKQGVVTQLGTQHHSTARLKIAVQVIREGVIGKVSEVHTWTDRPGKYWKQGLHRSASSDPVPSTLDWDLWLGTAPERPYVKDAYHSFHWRGWWDFGTRALGDMGCHLMDPIFNALELTAPTKVRAEGPPVLPESGPLQCKVDYTFPGTKHTTDTLKLSWYEAGLQPSRELIKAPKDWPGTLNGVVFVGERGNLFVGFPEMPQLFPLGDFKDYNMPEFQDNNHYTQWTSAILGEGTNVVPLLVRGAHDGIRAIGQCRLSRR